MIGRRGERGSGISVLAARHDDDGDDDLLVCYRERNIGGFIYRIAPVV